MEERMTKRQHVRWQVQEAMSRNAAGAGRNTALKKVADRFHLSTAAAGQLRAEVIFAQAPTKKFW
jgi:hypothetical protein